MKPWKAWACVIGIFIAGVVLGVVIGHRMTMRFAQKAATDPAFMRQVILKRLTSKLDLTEGQRKQIESIVRDSQVSIHDLRTEVEPRFSDILRNAERQITEVLDARQQEEFRKLIEERHRLWKPVAN